MDELNAEERQALGAYMKELNAQLKKLEGDARDERVQEVIMQLKAELTVARRSREQRKQERKMKKADSKVNKEMVDSNVVRSSSDGEGGDGGGGGDDGVDDASTASSDGVAAGQLSMSGGALPMALFGGIDESDVTWEDDAGPTHDQTTLHSGRVEKIVQILTQYKTTDNNDPPRQAFVLTASAWLSPVEFVDLLVARFSGPAADAPANVQKAWLAERQMAREGVLRLLKMWLDTGEESFSTMPSSAAVFAKLDAFNKNSVEAIGADETLKRLRGELYDSSQLARARAAPSVRTMHLQGLTTPRLSAKLEAPLDADGIGAQITGIEHDLVLKCQSKHFLKQAWTKKDKETGADLGEPINRYIDWFNHMSHYWATQILQCDSPEQRSATLVNIIAIACRFEQLRNFNGLMEVVTSLLSTPITRLTALWESLPKESTQAFERQRTLMQAKQNFKLYREAVKAAQGHAFVPYLGLFLQDFTFLDDLNSDYVDKLVNFHKMRVFGERLTEVLACKHRRYDHIKVYPTYRDDLAKQTVWNDDYIYHVSKLVQPQSADAAGGDAGKKRKKGGDLMSAATGKQTVDTEQEELTEEDWKRLTLGTAPTSYAAGTVIMEQGVPNAHFYRIASGDVDIEVKLPDDKVIKVATLSPGPQGYFGEMSVLDSAGKTGACVRAATECSVYKIDLESVFKIFSGDAGLNMRFFKLLAMTLAKRLRDKSAKRAGVAPEKKAGDDERKAELDRSSGASKLSAGGSSSLSAGKSSTMQTSDADKVVQKATNDPDAVSLKDIDDQLYVTAKHIVVRASNTFSTKHSAYKITDLTDRDKNEKKGELVLSFVVRTKEKSKKSGEFSVTKESSKKEKLKFKHDSDLQDAWQTVEALVAKQDSAASSATEDSAQGDHSGAESLNDEDWDQLLKGCKTLEFKKDDVIIKEGAYHQRLSQITTGVCRVEKAGKKLGEMKEGTLFGELSFLDGSGAAVSVVADGDVSLKVIEGYFISMLFKYRDGFGGRFYHYICTLLAERLK